MFILLAWFLWRTVTYSCSISLSWKEGRIWVTRWCNLSWGEKEMDYLTRPWLWRTWANAWGCRVSSGRFQEVFPAQNLPLGGAEVPSRSCFPQACEILRNTSGYAETPPPPPLQVPHSPSHDITPTSDLWPWTPPSSLETSLCSASFWGWVSCCGVESGWGINFNQEPKMLVWALFL